MNTQQVAKLWTMEQGQGIPKCTMHLFSIWWLINHMFSCNALLVLYLTHYLGNMRDGNIFIKQTLFSIKSFHFQKNPLSYCHGQKDPSGLLRKEEHLGWIKMRDNHFKSGKWLAIAICCIGRLVKPKQQFYASFGGQIQIMAIGLLPSCTQTEVS